MKNAFCIKGSIDTPNKNIKIPQQLQLPQQIYTCGLTRSLNDRCLYLNSKCFSTLV